MRLSDYDHPRKSQDGAGENNRLARSIRYPADGIITWIFTQLVHLRLPATSTITHPYYFMIAKKTRSTAFSLVLATSLVSNAQAAQIVWSAKEATVSGSWGQVLDTGLFNNVNVLYAENTGGEATTFDGINFTAGTITFDGEGLGVFSKAHEGGWVSDTAAFGRSNSGPNTIVLGTGSMPPLVVGQEYEVQLLVFDGRGESNGKTVSVDGVNQGIYGKGINGVNWGNSGLLLTGTFTADGSTQAITLETFEGSSSRGALLNALVLNTLSNNLNIQSLVINLGAGTVIEGNTFGSYAPANPTNLPLPQLPAGTILRSIHVNTMMAATDGGNFASDLALLFDPTPGSPGGDFTLAITNGESDFGATHKLAWPVSADGGPGTPLVDFKTESAWPLVGGIDLSTTGLFLGNAFGTAPQGGTWSGTITLTYELPGSPYTRWADGFLPADVSNPAGNYDNDALNNLQEFAFGTLPTASTGAIVYSGGTLSTPGAPGIVSGSGTYSIVFGRRADYVAAGLTYTVQFSADLETWVDNNDTSNPPVQVATDGTINAMSLPYPGFITTPNGTQEPTFSRVKVELAP
jgi:hypothetical protein